MSQKNDEKREKNYCIQSVLVKVAAQNAKFCVSKIPAQRGPAPLQLARARNYPSSLSVYFFSSADFIDSRLLVHSI